MYNSLSPPYLSALIPSSVGETKAYPLRNSDNIRSIQCKSQLFTRSFLPSTINLWNALPESVRSSPSLSTFKANLNKDKLKIPMHYYDGERTLNVLHARLRMHCSNLNEHLYAKNISESPYRQCGEIEDAFQFFYICPIYNEKRAILFDNLSSFQPITLQLLLFGVKDGSYEENSLIFEHVQYFIRDSHRF